MATIIKSARLLQPLPVVLACLAVTYCLTEAPWLQQAIHAMHRDPFTLGRSTIALGTAKIVLLSTLTLAIIFLLILKKRFSSTWKESWDTNFCLAALLGAIALALRLWQCPLGVDDAYIDYRYVLHWLSGQFDYNAGEHVMGFTSQLHLAVLALVCLVFHTQSVDIASYYLNCALDTACAVFLYFLALKVYNRAGPAFAAGLVYAFGMFACAEVTTGKESPLVNLILVLTLWAVHTGRQKFLPWCANALFLLRPEGIIAAAFILMESLKAQGKKALLLYILPCGITATWYAFLFYYFAAVTPHGMIAKYKVLSTLDPLSNLINYMSVTGLMATNSNIGFMMPSMGPWPCVIFTVLVFIYVYRNCRQPAWVLYRNIALAQLIFLLVARPVLFSWYLCWQALLGPVIMAQLTADAWVTADGEPAGIRQKINRFVVGFFMFAYLATGIMIIPFNWTPYFERGIAYREAALYVQDNTDGKDEVAASDVGLIGYFYQGRILDMMGLVSDQVLKYYPLKTEVRGLYKISPEAMAALKPKFLIAPLTHCQGLLLEDESFKKDYTEVKRWTNADMMDRVVCIWKRRQEAQSVK